MRMQSPVVLWNFLDGRRGHENQVRAFSDSVSALIPAQVREIRLQPEQYGMRGLLPSRWRTLLDHLPQPDLLIGAGHRTQASLLTCRRLYGGRSVILMKPGLPSRCFDFCLIPQHDTVRSSYPGILRTRGALTMHRRTGHIESQRKLILLGGPSRHYCWDSPHVIRVLQSLFDSEPGPWKILTSRRTPADFCRQWSQLQSDIPVLPPEDSAAEQEFRQLPSCSRLVVSCDSMSMIAEARATRADVSLLRLPERRRSRITREINRLISTATDVMPGEFLFRLPLLNTVGPSEAERCAALILQAIRADTVTTAQTHTRQLPASSWAGLLGRPGTVPADLHMSGIP